MKTTSGPPGRSSGYTGVEETGVDIGEETIGEEIVEETIGDDIIEDEIGEDNADDVEEDILLLTLLLTLLEIGLLRGLLNTEPILDGVIYEV